MAQRPLWTCPRCGKSYVTRNMWHSCVVVPLESHFVGRPRARELYDAVLNRLGDESQRDDELRGWLREARAVGDQLSQATRA